MQPESCLLCCKHSGLEETPPGGYIYQDERWMVCHAPATRGPLGTLFIESTRHVLDFAELNDAEAAAFGMLAKRLYAALRPLVGAERIYQVSVMEGVPHFHAWIVPRTSAVAERSVAFLAKDLTCNQEDAAELAARLRQVAQSWH